MEKGTLPFVVMENDLEVMVPRVLNSTPVGRREYGRTWPGHAPILVSKKWQMY